MNPHIKQLWLEALRSGEYKQTTGRLRDRKGFCCLGVLCDIYRKRLKNGSKWKKLTKLDDYFTFESKSRLATFHLTRSVSIWAGLKSDEGCFEIENIKTKTKSPSLASLNDSGRSFKQIANFIEKHF